MTRAHRVLAGLLPSPATLAGARCARVRPGAEPVSAADTRAARAVRRAPSSTAFAERRRPRARSRTRRRRSATMFGSAGALHGDGARAATRSSTAPRARRLPASAAGARASWCRASISPMPAARSGSPPIRLERQARRSRGASAAATVQPTRRQADLSRAIADELSRHRHRQHPPQVGAVRARRSPAPALLAHGAVFLETIDELAETDWHDAAGAGEHARQHRRRRGVRRRVEEQLEIWDIEPRWVVPSAHARAA